MNIETLNNKLLKYFNTDNIELIGAWRGELFVSPFDGYFYMFKVNHHNIYRVFCMNDREEMYFQCVSYAYVYSNGREIYDESVDYNDTEDLNCNMSKWFGLISQWINECETDDPDYTYYEFETE